MNLLDHVRIGARASRLANHRLHTSMAAMGDAEFGAPRTGFFPSLAATLNHVLVVDIFYIAALYREHDMREQWRRFVPCTGVAGLTECQQVSDERLIALLDRFDDTALDADVFMDRAPSPSRTDRAGHVLAHLFMHQTHHRGQAHAMLSSTGIEPPQLDDFLLPSDAPYRSDDLKAMGWTERDIFGADERS